MGGMKFFTPFYGICMPGKFGRKTWSNKAGAMPGEKMWSERVEQEPITGFGASPQRGAGQSPWSGGQGTKPPEAENLLAFAAQRKQQIFFILQAPNRDRPNPLLLSKNSPDLHQSQERPLAKVGWTCPPQSTVWRRP